MQATRIFSTTYYSNELADVPEAVRWTQPVNATVTGAAAESVAKRTAGGWSGGAVGTRAIGESLGTFQGALTWQAPAGWNNHFFLGLVAADTDATNPDYPSFTLGLYLNVDAASGNTFSFDVYQAGSPRYAGRAASPPVYWYPGAHVEVQVWRASGGGFTGRFLLDERLVYELPLPALAFPLTPHLSLYGAAGQVVSGFTLRGPALVASGYGAAELPAAGLRLHLRPDLGLEQAPDGTVTGWADQSGAGWQLRPVAGQALPVTGALGGGQGVYLNGNQYFELLDLGGPAPDVFTVAVVLQAAHTNAQMPLGFGPDQAHANDLWCVNNVFGHNTFNDDVYGIAPASPALTQPVLVVAQLHSNNTSAFRLWLNGQPQEVGPCRNTPGSRPLGTVLGLGASGFRDYGAYAWQGWLGEIAIYDRELNQAEQQQVHESIRRRYPALPAYVLPPPPLADAPDPAPPTASEVPAQPLGWWRAASGLHRTADGRLLRWDDLSGQGRSLGPDPTYAAPALREWAGGRALYFNGQQALAALDLGGTAPTVLTAVLFLQKQAGATSTMPIHFGADNNQDLWVNADCFGLNTYNSDILGIQGAEARLGQPVLVVAEVHANQPAAFQLWLNGQAQPVAQQLNSTGAHGLDTIVRLGGNAQWRWRGWLAEALLYDRALTDTEQAQLVTYVKGRYQLPS